MAFDDLLRQRLAGLTASPNAFINGIEENAISRLNDMIALLAQLDVDSQGNIRNTAKNLRAVQTITSQIGDVYYDEGYVTTLRSFAETWGDQLEVNKEYLSSLGNFTDDELFSLTMRTARRQAVQSLSRTAVNSHLLDPLSAGLVNAVSTTWTFADTVDLLKNSIGAGQVESRWMKHAKQIAFDGYAITDRQTATLMAVQNGYVNYAYYGTAKDTTRCFCRERVGKVFTLDQYREWGARQNIGACAQTQSDGQMGWAGMIEMTNADNILSYMGGYNCRHLPVAQK